MLCARLQAGGGFYAYQVNMEKGQAVVYTIGLDLLFFIF